MKKTVPIFLCLFTVLSMILPVSAKSHLFHINPDTIDKIEIRIGPTEHILSTDENAELIRQIIQSLNDFEYTETEQVGDFYGTYVRLVLTSKDGTEQSITIDPNGAYPPNSSNDVKYISADPDYFRKDWLYSIFPYSFTDINIGTYPPIKTLYDNSLMLGTSETTFSPESIMTRGMFVTVLGRMADINEEDYRKGVFEDVPEAAYFSPYASWAYQNGIIKGTSANTFSPNAPVTREQAAVILARFAEAQNLTFLKSNIIYRPDFAEIQDFLEDVQNTSEEFQEKYPALYAAHIIRGKDGRNMFEPADTLTRREAADILEITYNTLYEE